MKKDFLNEIELQLNRMFIRQQIGWCPVCSEPVDKSLFRDSLSKKEFELSGLCQKCQDDVFSEEDEL
jgi:hypothetical protein